MRELLKLLERPWRVEPFIYRHHRLFGGFIAAGALLFVAFLINFAHFRPMLWFLLSCFDAVVLVIGLVVLVRPSLLKRTEAVANRWVDIGSLFSHQQNHNF